MNAHNTGLLARSCCGLALPLAVLHSAAGWYVGTRDADGLPSSRESEEYWPTRAAALHALEGGGWTQRLQP